MATRKSDANEATSVSKRAGKPAGLDQGVSRGAAPSGVQPTAAELS